MKINPENLLDFNKQNDWVKNAIDFDITNLESMLSKNGEKFWIQAGEKRALYTFHQAAIRVPAYKNFLKKHQIDHQKIVTIKDFLKVPLTDKKNYIYAYSLKNIFPYGRIPHFAYASSGSSGKRTFWFRNIEQEKEGGKIHEIIFRDIFKIRKQDKTLVVVCFAMGIWVAGNYTTSACRYISEQGYDITTITPGIEQNDFLQILEDLAPQYKNLIIAGYPPFVMDMLLIAKRRKIKLNNNLFIFTAGDKFSEQWRADILNNFYLNKNHLEFIINAYGSADAGIIAHETPLSIFIRKKALKDKFLYNILFNGDHNIPGFFQFNPSHNFIEEAEENIVLTTNIAVPLIRYNTKDVGKIFSYREIKDILKQYNYDKEASFYEIDAFKNLPFIVVKGRSDVAVTFYALNIFPENIKIGVQDKRCASFLSGNFFVSTQTTHHSSIQTLCVDVELAKGTKGTESIKNIVQKSVFENLLKVNSEFHKLYLSVGKKSLPKIKLIPYKERYDKTSKKRGILNIAGKKPRMII